MCVFVCDSAGCGESIIGVCGFKPEEELERASNRYALKFDLEVRV